MPQPDGAVDSRTPAVDPLDDTDAAVEAGLDALDTPSDPGVSGGRALRVVGTVLPPLIALALAIAVWQVLWAAAFWPEFRLPAPLAVWGELRDQVTSGAALGYVWTSVSRAVV